MILQVRQQKVDELHRTILIAQGEPPEELEELSEFISNWMKDLNERNPLPEGYQWLLCNEESEYFVLAPLEKP